MSGQSDDTITREAILILTEVLGELTVGVVHLLGTEQVNDLLGRIDGARTIANRIDAPRGVRKEPKEGDS